MSNEVMHQQYLLHLDNIIHKHKILAAKWRFAENIR